MREIALIATAYALKTFIQLVDLFQVCGPHFFLFSSFISNGKIRLSSARRGRSLQFSTSNYGKTWRFFLCLRQQQDDSKGAYFSGYQPYNQNTSCTQIDWPK